MTACRPTAAPPPLPNMQWYTPLMAWWLPQRTLLFGFAAAICVLLLVLAGASSHGPSWEPFALAGVLIGLLPIVHVQTLIALSILLFVLLWRRRRREWFALLGVAVLLGGVRLAQLALSQHGASVTPYGTNVYPWLEPGWLANAGTAANPSGRLDVVARQPVQRRHPGDRRWSAPRSGGDSGSPTSESRCRCSRSWRSPPSLGSPACEAGRVITAAFPVPLLELALGALIIFAACNLVVFQSWNWDNTKLLVYWYLVIALLIGALATHWWRRVWPRVAAIVLVAPVLLTGALVVLRLLPWTPPEDAITGPYTIANTQELQLASTIDRVTPKGAVFLTFGRPNDPGARSRRSHRGDGLRRLALELRHQLRDPLRGRPDDVHGLRRRCGDLPGLQPPAQVRHQLRGDRQPADRPRRGRFQGGPHMVGGPGSPGRGALRSHHHLRRAWKRLT